jgi:hypothetical protein
MIQYEIVDGPGLITSVGGGLGLLLGFSFYNLLEFVIDSVLNVCHKFKENGTVF